MPTHPSIKYQAVVDLYSKLGGNTAAVARELNAPRATVWDQLKAAGALEKPLAGGSVEGIREEPLVLPAKGKIKRYLLTSAQNNTHLHEGFWKNLLALKAHYKAELLIGTYSYNKNSYGQLAVKRGTKGPREKGLWYDERLVPYFCDKRILLGRGLVWCGELNVLPTAEDPLSGFEVYTSRNSSIIPHAKIRMRSVATAKDGPGAKLMYTTGTCTLCNYLQKKAGQKAEFHHAYACLVVEVNDEGHWWCRQCNAEQDGRIQDLDVVVEDGKVTTGNSVEAITYGDIHSDSVDPEILESATGKDGMQDVLHPKYVFLHDLFGGASVNPHGSADPHERFKAFVRGLSSVQSELNLTGSVLQKYIRPWCNVVVVNSNHDNWLYRWLKTDFRLDPLNARLYLQLQLAVYTALERRDKKFNLLQYALQQHPRYSKIASTTFLQQDQSFLICNRQIECGAHGHLGPNGCKGSAKNLRHIGKRANVGHYHSAEIIDGLYATGTSTVLDMDYNRGPSSWSHSHIVTYKSGKRAIITVYDGKWKA